MAVVNNKRVLKKIAKEWAASMLSAIDHSNGNEDDLLSFEEMSVVLKEVQRIADSLHESPRSSFSAIVKRYFLFKDGI